MKILKHPPLFLATLEPCIEIWKKFLNFFGLIMAIENLQKYFDFSI
jgi:hypothetical protein